MTTDPIADMLTRIRNAVRASKDEVSLPHSKTKEQIAKLLQQEGYIHSYDVSREGVKANLRVKLKYGAGGEPTIHHIERVSKPGRRIYHGVDELHLIRRGMGTAIVSTSQGLIPDRECRRRKIGGEVVCILW
jgi:small subunit ribosomal protein S8